jgi:tetratricopeptide (TPR) repeat protein
VSFERTLDDVVETLQMARHRGKSCTLLIGAGCSVEAGIPHAQGFLNIIKTRHPRAYERAKEKTYADCMAQLSPDERRDLLSEFIDKAKINWAHVAIAQLLKHGYVDRVLTTNFDPLVVRACGLAGVYPAVFDLAASGIFRADWVPSPAVIYLHGQRSGFVMRNVKDDFHYGEAVEEALDDAGRRRVWLVVGYSGTSDPVFQRLAATPRFDNNLFWVGYKDQEPTEHVREGLLKEGKFGHYVRGYDADGFLVLLCQRLGVFPPEFIAKPFTYLDGILATLAPFTLPEEESAAKNTRVGITDRTRRLLRQAVEAYERPAEEKSGPSTEQAARGDTLALNNLILSGDYAGVLDVLRAVNRPLSSDERRQFVLAATQLAKKNTRDLPHGTMSLRALGHFRDAVRLLEEAEKLEPDSPLLQRSWGMLLVRQADGLEKAEREQALSEAIRRLMWAAETNPSDASVQRSLGKAYRGLASARPDQEVQLLQRAAECFATAESQRPGDIVSLQSWKRVAERLLEIDSPEERASHEGTLRLIRGRARAHGLRLD